MRRGGKRGATTFLKSFHWVAGRREARETDLGLRKGQDGEEVTSVSDILNLSSLWSFPLEIYFR